MRTLVATMNIGGTYLTDNTRRSMLAACERWGSQFMEIVSTEERLNFWSREPNAFMSQLHIWKYLPSDYDRILLIDGDTLIRSDCPSPFWLVPPSHLGVVPNFQGDTHDDPEKDHQQDWDEMRMWFTCGSEYDPSQFFNGGFVVLTPLVHRETWLWIAKVYETLYKHRRTLEIRKAQTNGDQIPGEEFSPSEEQAALNVGFAASKLPIKLLPYEFNRLGPSVWENESAMTSFVNHYAMFNGQSKERKRRLLETVPWQV